MIDVYSERVPVSMMKFCRKPFRVVTLNDIPDELSSTLVKNTAKRGKPHVSKRRRGKGTRVILPPFKVSIVHEVGYVCDSKSCRGLLI